MEADRLAATEQLTLSSTYAGALEKLYDLAFSGVVNTQIDELRGVDGLDGHKSWAAGQRVESADGAFVGHERAVAAMLAWSWVLLRRQRASLRDPSYTGDRRAPRVAFWESAVLAAVRSADADERDADAKPRDLSKLWTLEDDDGEETTVLQRDWVLQVDDPSAAKLLRLLLDHMPATPHDQAGLNALNEAFQEAHREQALAISRDPAAVEQILRDKLMPSSAQNLFGQKRGPAKDEVLRLRDLAIVDAFMFFRWKGLGKPRFVSLLVNFPEPPVVPDALPNHGRTLAIKEALKPVAARLRHFWGDAPARFVARCVNELEAMDARPYASTRTTEEPPVVVVEVPAVQPREDWGVASATALQAMTVHVKLLLSTLDLLPDDSVWRLKAQELEESSPVVAALLATFGEDPSREMALLDVTEEELWLASLQVADLRAWAMRDVSVDSDEEGDR